MDKWKNRWPGGLFGRPIRLWLFALTLCLLLFLSIGLLFLLLLQLPAPEDASRRGQQHEPIIAISQQRQHWLLFEPKWPEVEDPDPETAGWAEQQAGNGSSGGAITIMDSKKSFINERDLAAVIVGQASEIERRRPQEEANFKLAASSIDQETAASNGPRPARNESGAGRRRRRFSRAESMRFVLMCQVLDGESPIQIKWFKDNEELITSPDSAALLTQPGSSSNRLLVLPSEQVELVTNDELGASLLFRRVQQQHGGNYTCLATNQYGSSSFSSFMSVKVPPSWKVEPQDQHSIMGDQIIIDCQATGNPNPFIRWKFTSIQQNTGQLVGGASELDASMGRQQQQMPMGAEVGPTSSTATTMLGGHPILATNFKLINSNHHVQTLENGSLSIRQAQKEHEGFYLCEADNGVEPNLVKTLRLVVHLQAQFADELQLIEPATGGSGQRPGGSVQSAAVATVGGVQAATNSLQLAAKSVRLALGANQMRILCQPMGDPPLTLEWLKDGQPIYTHTTPADLSLLASQKHQQQQQQWSHSSEAAAPNHHVSTRRSLQRPQVGLESELVVTSIRRQDAGLYTCLARNAYGQAESRLRLVVQEPPEPPELVDVAHIGSRSIALRWLAPFDGNSPITKYTVEFRRQVDSSIDNSVDQQSLVYGAQSDKLMSSKLATDLQPSGAIVQSPMLNSASLPAPQQQLQQQQVQHTIHDLEPLAGYSMRVVAVNAIGRSRPSVALSLRTDEEVPSVVPGLVEAMVLSSKSIKLRWSISYSPAHEIIDGFFVGYRSLESPVAPQQTPGAPSALATHQPSQVGNSLNVGAPTMPEQPTFTYKTIRLTNQQQKSNNGADLQQGSGETGSGLQPSDSSSAFLSPVSSVTKTLPASSANPFAISHHQASGGAGGGSQLSPLPQKSQQVVVVSAFEYVINGLDRNTEYTILIQCFNRKGAGPTSDPVVFKTFMNDPPEKLVLVTDEIKESSLRLSWRFLGSERFATPNVASRSQEPVDGFVLTFAKVTSQIKGSSRMVQQQIGGGSNEQAVADTSKRALGQPAARISNQQPPVDQWQAIQLAPQQRSHQLKNLECGTSYVMKIWAFNKIGNGDPSDLITVKTQGKAPIAPEKRALISANSTQLRLHLSAWYDGGCEIDKFVVQYRIRGQQEWLLVSNNILRDQASVIIRDLMPATSYEILVAASNQVATTEARYRVVTLDSDGKPVTQSFLGNLPTLEDFEDDQIPVSDYTDPDGTRRSERWPNDPTGTGRSLALFRNLMNSPMALILSLCLLVVIIMVLLLYKFNTLSSSSNSTLNSNKSSSSGSGASAGGRQGSCDATTMMLSSSERGPLSLANESPGDSPQIGGPTLTAGQRLHGFPPPPQTQLDCQYQSFCAATSHQQQQQPIDYGRAGCVQDNNSPYPTVGSYGTHQASTNYSMGPYTSVQRSTTLDSCQNNNGQLAMEAAENSDQRQQQCLMQMLMMGSQQHQLDGGSYVAALTTMARGNKNNSKHQFNHQHPIQSNNNTYVTQGFNTGTSTLGRHTAIDYQRLQQQHQHQQSPQQVADFPGKQLNLMAGSNNLIDANHHQSNNFSMATNMHQTNEDREAASEELYSMSTFTRHHPSEHSASGQPAEAPMARPPVGGAGGGGFGAIQTTYCGSSSTTTSTSGCGTDGSADQQSVATVAGSNTIPSIDQQIATALHQQEMNQVLPLFATEQPILATAAKQTSIVSSGNSASSHQLSSSDDIGANSDRENCDKSTSQYDVPFKFINHNTITKELENNKDPEFGTNICY